MAWSWRLERNRNIEVIGLTEPLALDDATNLKAHRVRGYQKVQKRTVTRSPRCSNASVSVAITGG
jgi:hypothetical protein